MLNNQEITVGDKKKDNIFSIEKYFYGKEIYVYLILVITIGLFVFKDYLVFNKFYIFKDIASDSYNQVYPYIVHISGYIKSEGIPKWSFGQGMGQNIFPGGINSPFTMVLALLGKNNLPYGFVYVEFFKVIIGGLFFFLYLRTIRLNRYTSIIGSLLLSYSGYMIVGGNWYGHSSTVVYSAFLLFSFEQLFKKNRWIYFPLAIFFISSCSIFYLFTFGLFLLLYSTFRYVDEKGIDIKGYSKLIYKMFLLLILGLGISCVFIFSDVIRMMDSPRVSGESGLFNSLLSRSIFSPGTYTHNVTALLRFFSSDILGTGSNFKGWGNYLEAPVFYCGLISLLITPQIFIFLNKRRKILFAVYITFWSLVIIFPFLRHSFYLFAGDYYKGGISFFVPATLLFFSLNALNKINILNKVNTKLLIGTLAILLVILSFPYVPGYILIKDSIRNRAIVLLIFYTVIIFLLTIARYKPIARFALLFLICVELAGFSSITLNDRQAVSPEELNGKTGFNDYTNDAVKFLKSIDKDFYRVEKYYRSGTAIHSSFNDALIQDYYGTPSYASFNQKYYIKFLAETETIDPRKETETRWAVGPRAILLQTIVSVKYILAKKKNFSIKSYTQIGRFGDVNVYKNSFFLPMGFTYDKCMPHSEFKKLSKIQKNLIFLKACVIDNDQIQLFKDITLFKAEEIPENYFINQYVKDTNSLKQDSLLITKHSHNNIQGIISLEKKKLLFFSIPYDKGWTVRVDGGEIKTHIVNIGFMGFLLDKGKHSVELIYQPPYLGVSTSVFILSVFVYLFLIFLKRKQIFQQQLPIS